MEPTDLAESVKEFLKTQNILIADPNPVSRAYLVSILLEMGAATDHVFHAKDMVEAEYFLKEFRASVVLCDELMGRTAAVGLLRELRREQAGGGAKIFFYLTENTSQAEIGRAAEDDVDGFILKPFTRKEFRFILSAIIREKLSPSEYQKKVAEGKDLLFRGEVERSIEVLQEAVRIAENPAQAQFYIGQAQLMKRAIDESRKAYVKGVTLNQIHYKCLSGLYELLAKEKKDEEAYEVLRRLVSLFPANPKRLAGALKMSIRTGNFRDVENFYEFFSAIDERTDDLTNHMCSALAVNGKFHLIHRQMEQALSSFEKAAKHGEGREKFVAYIVESLTRFGFAAEAEEFRKRFTASKAA